MTWCDLARFAGDLARALAKILVFDLCFRLRVGQKLRKKENEHEKHENEDNEFSVESSLCPPFFNIDRHSTAGAAS